MEHKQNADLGQDASGLSVQTEDAQIRQTSVDMSAHFTTLQLLKYAAPSMAMMVFTSIYGVVDGFFVSNFAGSTAFAAVNFIMPFIMILCSVGFMVGTGGSALIASAAGEGDVPRANSYFCKLVTFTFMVGIVVAVFGFFFARPLAQLMGATGIMLDLSEIYARISMISLPFYMLQCLFQAFFNTAGKPKVGFVVTLCAGCTNIVLDIVFVGILGFGVEGAAAATVCSEFIGGGVSLIYFTRKNPTPYTYRPVLPNPRLIGRTCINGSSEMVANIAMSLVGMVYNIQLLRLLGENGVSAYGVIMYVSLLFSAIFIGYEIACSPLMSFQNGAGNTCEKRSLFKKSMLIISVASVILFVIGESCAYPIAYIFTGYNQDLCDLTVMAFRMYACSFLFMGIAMYGSAFFTSLENGLISAIISFVRTLVCELGAVIILPYLFGAQAIWLSFVVAEIVAALLSGLLIVAFSRKYGFRD